MSQQALTPLHGDMDEDEFSKSLTEAMQDIAHQPVSLRERTGIVTPIPTKPQNPVATAPTPAQTKRQELIEQQIAMEKATPAHKADLLANYFRGMLQQSERQLSELKATQAVDVKAARENTEAQLGRIHDELAELERQKARLQASIDETNVEGKRLVETIETQAQVQIEAQQTIVSSLRASLIPFEKAGRRS